MNNLILNNLIDNQKINNTILTIICLIFYFLVIKDSYKLELKAIFENQDLKKIKLIFLIILLIYYFYKKTFKEKKKSVKSLVIENYSKVVESLCIAFLFSISLLLVNKPILYPFIIIFLRSYLIKKSDKFNPKDIFCYIQIFNLLLPTIILIFKIITKSKKYTDINNSNIKQIFINLGIGTIIINKYMDDRDYDLITLAYQVMIYTSLYKYTILKEED